jgi:dinuclear metal center YbgI/SA1388 family protein
MRLHELCDWLDELLSVRDIEDHRDAMNGLQVECDRDIRRVALAVDACEASILAAIHAGAELLLVHHGLFWGPRRPVIGATRRRLAPLLREDVGLYSAHLPLDVHPVLGNNAQILLGLGLEPTGRFASERGVFLGLSAETDLDPDGLLEALRRLLGVEPRFLPTGRPRVGRLGVVSGKGGSLVEAAAGAGIDTLLTGEVSHPSFLDAEERSMNLVLAGHYATETLGLVALGRELERVHGLQTVWIEHPTGL